MVTQPELIELVGSTLRRFFHDTFLSTEMLTEVDVGSGAVVAEPFELQLATGATDASSVMVYYDSAFMNPWYATLIWKMQLSSAANVFAFVGMKETTGAPTSVMVESHIGVMVENGKMYFSSADGYDQQKTEITGYEITDALLFRLDVRKLAIRPVPVQFNLFDSFRYEQLGRKWSNENDNGTSPPKDEEHYFVFYIGNTTAADKKLYVNHVTYGEIYAD